MSYDNEQGFSPDSSELFSAEVIEPKTGSGWSTCLIGCLILFLVGVCICGGVGLYAYRNIGKATAFVADMTRDTIVSGIEESDLNEEEKEAIVVQVDRVVDQYKSGEITLSDLQRVMQELAESPVMGAIIILSIEAKYLAPSGLSDEEKQQARLTMQRVLRGVTEESIDQDDLKPAMAYVMIERADGSQELKESLTDRELRDFLVELKQQADQAEIPEEPYEVKISDEFRQAIDRALNAS